MHTFKFIRYLFFFIQNTTETENIILNVETETEGFTNNIDVLHGETDEEIIVVWKPWKYQT